MRILLITGGWSGERQVALNGAKVLRSSMEELGHSVEWFDLVSSLEGLGEAVNRNDFAFINLHGSPGEDGLVQSCLDLMGMPYQGSGPAASMLALDKAAAKVFYRKAGLLTAKSILLTKKPQKGWKLPLEYPVFAKENSGGSTLNLEYIPDAESFEPAMDRLFTTATDFIVEEAVVGKEITCGVFGELVNGKEVARALPPIEIVPKSESGLFDYESKYTVGGAEEICPAPLPPKQTNIIQNMAVKAHEALGLAGYSRADFILKENGDPIILEVNTLPGLTATSLIPQELAVVGVSFTDMVERLISMGMAMRGPKTNDS